MCPYGCLVQTILTAIQTPQALTFTPDQLPEGPSIWATPCGRLAADAYGPSSSQRVPLMPLHRGTDSVICQVDVQIHVCSAAYLPSTASY